MHIRHDSRLQKQLNDEQIRLVYATDPEFGALEREAAELSQAMRNRYTTITRAPAAQQAEYRQLGNKINARQTAVKPQKLEQLIRDFHNTADLEHMVAQLEGD